MFCTNCGAQLPPGATACPSCAKRIRPFAAPAPIPNYLVGAILTTLCCCLPLGIVSLVYAVQVNSKLAAGDIAGAQQASNKAKLWMWIAIGAGLLTGAASALLSLMG